MLPLRRLVYTVVTNRHDIPRDTNLHQMCRRSLESRTAWSQLPRESNFDFSLSVPKYCKITY